MMALLYRYFWGHVILLEGEWQDGYAMRSLVFVIEPYLMSIEYYYFFVLSYIFSSLAS